LHGNAPGKRSAALLLIDVISSRAELEQAWITTQAFIAKKKATARNPRAVAAVQFDLRLTNEN
jgi:hypothetical protein